MRRLLVSLTATVAVAASLLISSAGPATAAADSSLASASTQSGDVTPNAKLPAAIQVDETKYKIVATLRGVGKQVYDCPTGATTYTFREPVAGLFTPRGIPAGIHGAGPFWANFDGSRFIGTGAVTSGGGSVPAPKPASDIAWLRVAKVSSFGTGGVFSNVAFIQRVDTRGGVAPTSCGAPTVAVDYTTNYVFWAPK